MTSSKRAGTGMFGWCIDDLHDKCIEWFTNSDRRCTCDCHSTRRETHMDTSVNTWAPEVPAQGMNIAEIVTETITSTSDVSVKVDARAIRAWAKSQGIEVGARGRIKPDVIARYNEAHQ